MFQGVQYPFFKNAESGMFLYVSTKSGLWNFNYEKFVHNNQTSPTYAYSGRKNAAPENDYCPAAEDNWSTIGSNGKWAKRTANEFSVFVSQTGKRRVYIFSRFFFSPIF